MVLTGGTMSQDRDRRRQRRETNRKFKARDRGDWSDGPRPKRKGAWNPRKWDSNAQNHDFERENDSNFESF